MNPPLQMAEKSLLCFLRTKPDGSTMDELLKGVLSVNEAELRAAVWTLCACGDAFFNEEGRLCAS